MEKELYDVIIIGSGPAGLSASIYAARANLKTIIIESEVNGGKLYKTFEIENYPGVKKISGVELANQLVEHTKDFGIQIISGKVLKVSKEDSCQKVELAGGKEMFAKNVIVASGTKERELDLENAKEFTGRGISYCAVCDGFFYRKKDVVVIGGGNSALEEALYLATIAKSVTIVIRRDVFRADRKVVDEIMSNEKIKVVNNSIPSALLIEDDAIIGLKVKDVKTGIESDILCSGIFPYIGADPNTDFLDSSVLNENGYMIVAYDMSTSIEGLYGAGDVIDKQLRQVITACNDGAIAANAIAKKML